MYQWLVDHLPDIMIALFGASTILQISPIKINPWTSLFRWIGRTMVGELSDKLDKIEATNDERYVKQCRMRILRFSDEILQEMRHSKEHYDMILDDVTDYKRYCAVHPAFENEKANMAIQNIQNRYQYHIKHKDFL